MAQRSIEWEAAEHVITKKSSDWFWAVGIITISAIITCIILHNILFAIVILLSSIALTMHAVKEPPIHHYRITDRGIYIGDLFYPFSTLESYWLEEDFDPLKLIIKSKKVLMPYIIIPLDDDMDPDEVNDYMSASLPIVEHHESIFHKLLEYLGF